MEEIQITTTGPSSSEIGLMNPDERDLFVAGLAEQLGLTIHDAIGLASVGIAEYKQRLLSEDNTLPELAARQMLALAQGKVAVLTKPFIVENETAQSEALPQIQPLSDTFAISQDVNAIQYVASAGSQLEARGFVVLPGCPWGDLEYAEVQAEQRISMGVFSYSDSPCVAGLTRDMSDLAPSNSKTSLEEIQLLESYARGKYLADSSPGAIVHASAMTKASPILTNILAAPKVKPIVIVDRVKISQDIYEMLSQAFSGVISLSSERAFEADLLTGGISELYWAALSQGTSSEEAQRLFKIKQQIVRDRKFKSEIALARSINAAKISAIKMAVEQKFGKRVLDKLELAARINPVSSFSQLLEYLEPAQAKIVSAELARRDKRARAYTSNKCEHIAALASLRRAADPRQIKSALDVLKPFISPGPKTSMLECRVCKFEIMCPHEMELFIAESASENFTETRKRLQPFLDTSARGVIGYYCKVCGEVLAANISDDTNEMVSSGTMDEDLRSILWSEAGTALTYVRAETIINPRQIIEALVVACYPKVQQMETQLIKSRTISSEELASRRRLYVSFYAFAFLVHLFRSNPTIHFRGQKPGASAPEMIKYAIGLIMGSKNIILRTMSDVSIETIANNLVGAYKELQSVSGPIKFSQELEPVSVLLPRDPVFRYIADYNLAEELASGKMSATRAQKYNPVENTDWLLGASLAKLEKQKNIFEHTRDGRVQAKSKPDQNLSLWVHRRSYEEYVKYLRAGNFSEHGLVAVTSQMLEDALEASSTKDGDPANIPFTDPRNNFLESLSSVREVENKLLNERKWKNARSTGHHVIAQRSYTTQASLASRLFDAQGRPHVFSIYLAGDTEYTRASIQKMLASNEEPPAVFDDMKCSICGIKKSETDSLDDDLVRAGIAELAILGNFFKFYEINCPAGDFHERQQGDSPCAKCGITFKNISSPGSEESRAIYAKYKEAWARDQAELITPDSLANTDNSSRLAWESQTKARMAKFFESWVYSIGPAEELAAILKIDTAYLLGIAGTESLIYSEIPENISTIEPPENIYDSRAYRVHAHIIGILAAQGRLKKYFTITKPTEIVSKIIEVSKLTGEDLRKAVQEFPEPDQDFCTAFEYIREAGSPQVILEFSLFSLWRILLEIHSADPLRLAFVQVCAKRILSTESGLSKPGYFNWGLVFGNDSTLLSDTGEEIIFSAQVEDDGTDDIDEDVEKNPFSVAAFDMEERDSEYIDPDEETGVNIRSDAMDANGL